MKEQDLIEFLTVAVRDGFSSAIRDRLMSLHANPLQRVVEKVFSDNEEWMKSILNDAISVCINSPDFREAVKQAVRERLAKTLVQRFGGELERQVNVLKSDPATRARITLAIESMCTPTSP